MMKRTTLLEAHSRTWLAAVSTRLLLMSGFALSLVIPLADTRADVAMRRCERLDAVSSTLSSSTRGQTKRCLGCHDGVLAPDIDMQPSAAVTFGEHQPHPVGVSYRDAWSRSPGTYKPPWEVKQRLRLPGGKVQCTSCHPTSASESATLVVPNHGSALCQTCHSM